MFYKYPVYQPKFFGNEKIYVNDCIDSTWISSKGKYIEKFENRFAEFLNTKYAVAVSNGTVALHLALLSLGIGIDDEVIVPSFTYIASVNAITYTGAKPIFADSLPDTWQIDPNDIIRKITNKTKAIIAVHLYGHPCNMDEITTIAKKYNLFVVEDCAESFGSLYHGKHTGVFGDISTFSFFGNKTITTGEGGMVATNNKVLYDRSVHFKGQGLAEGREYWHDVIGYNYRMTNICAAIGLAQLEHADEIIKKKKIISDWYKKYINKLQVIVHQEIGDVYHSYWMVSILVEKRENRNLLRDALKKNEIETRPTFSPVHTMPMYAKNSYKLPVAEDLGLRGINLPSYPDLTEEDVIYICGIIKEFYESR